ncbi:MAG TPA: aminotransferase class V-fold PLP-dependent enzyme [Acetobacteraceae bacterium]|jgi:alanine-glyoxylate transaminase/serine-glyoxylate transaminase/serine-pyruvate transaminase|nr:aminotransferase class V-fold PLP-dependent enzyme [Acetobacteraceae bacterium]
MSTTVTKPRGRHFFANPGPTNIPDSVLRAIDRPSIDFHDPDFREVYDACFEGVKRILRTQHRLFMYTGSGHAAWEASLTNLLSPGDTILLLESGYFSDEWAKMARALKVEVRPVAADWRHGVDIANVKAALAEDTAHAIKAVCVVHNETATGLFIPIPEVRAAIDAVKHPALLLVDTISSLGSLDFRMDEWKIDGVVGGGQKGLMLPTGMSFTAVSPKALEVHKNAKLARFYFDWTLMLARNPQSFIGTIPVNFFYGLKESIRLLEEEVLPNVIARHHRLGEAARRAVKVWAGNNGPQLFCTNPGRFSDSVTAVQMPEGHDAEALRRTARQRFNVSLGGGLGKLNGRVFRIGHLGDLNEPMVLGALSAVEMSLRINNVPHGRGGVDAAMDYLTG